MPSGRLLWEWRSLDHVGVTETDEPTRSARRSTTSTSTGSRSTTTATSLVSARNTSAAVQDRAADGKVLWRLGGKRSDFSMGKGTQFGFQHDRAPARGRPDDQPVRQRAASRSRVRPESRAIVLAVDQRRRQVTLKREIRHRRPLFAFATGSNQLLPNGNRLVTWGITGWFTEYDAGRPRSASTPTCRGGPELPRLPVPVGRETAACRRRSRPTGRAPERRGSTRAGTARPRSPPGGSRPGEARGLRPGGAHPKRGFETSFAIPPRTR